MKGRDLREIRSRLKLTQEQVAAIMGVHRNVYGRWERSRGKVRPLVELAMAEVARRHRKG